MACQVVSGWIKRLRDRDLVMPICEGLLEQGWIEANGLMPHAQHHDLREQLWLLLPSGPVPQSREARHLIHTLRQPVVKAGEMLLIEHRQAVSYPSPTQEEFPPRHENNNAEPA